MVVKKEGPSRILPNPDLKCLVQDSHGSLGNLGVGKLSKGGQKGRNGKGLKQTCFAVVSTEQYSNYPWGRPGTF